MKLFVDVGVVKEISVLSDAWYFRGTLPQGDFGYLTIPWLCWRDLKQVLGRLPAGSERLPGKPQWKGVNQMTVENCSKGQT